MNEENSDEYYKSLRTQPHRSSYNKYDCVVTTTPKRAFCVNECEVEYNTESDDSVRDCTVSTCYSSKNNITPERPSIPDSICCEKSQHQNRKR